MPHTLHQPLPPGLAPAEVAAWLRHLPGLVFFDSARENPSSLSLIAANPRETVTGSTAADWALLREKVGAAQKSDAMDRGLPNGFAAGIVNYDGSFWFGFYGDALIYRHGDQSWHATGGGLAQQMRETADRPIASAPHFSTDVTCGDFCKMVRRAQDYIAAGDIYQVNLSHQFTAPWRGDPWRFHQALRLCSPAPHSAFLDLDGRSVLSSSPELFLQMSGRQIRTRPIKGTRPRRAQSAADRKSAYDLVTSPKEMAELLMITDLERNDLGKICEYGSIKVTELNKLERFEQVFHLVSTVGGRLRAEMDHVSALQSCFPGGSITGAPKKRACEIIAELEPVPRGLYTGAIGYFGFNGESQFSIAIRTVLIGDGIARFHVGAGIVADSVGAEEYQETLDKAAGILLAAVRL